MNYTSKRLDNGDGAATPQTTERILYFIKTKGPVSTASLAVHRLALVVMLALQLGGAIAAWSGVALFVGGGGAIGDALPWLNLALCAMAAFLLLMHLGGLWFGYWIAQEGLQTTHLVLLLWTLGLFVLFNAQRT